jgi:hypothetical protein
MTAVNELEPYTGIASAVSIPAALACSARTKCPPRSRQSRARSVLQTAPGRPSPRRNADLALTRANSTCSPYAPELGTSTSPRGTQTSTARTKLRVDSMASRGCQRSVTRPVSDLVYFRGLRRNAARHCDLHGMRRRVLVTARFRALSAPASRASPSETGVGACGRRPERGGAVAAHDVDGAFRARY